MEKGNVLVIGNSGVGKSTLINAVMGDEVAPTGWGTSGTTKELQIYESEQLPFRIIDTIGFEPSFLKEQKAIHAIKKWSKESAAEGQEEKQINLIWFCIDGTSRKLFEKTIKDLSKATAMWESVPLVVVITKSYSIPERAENIEMVNNAFAKQKKYSKNLKKVIPVVASKYELNDYAFAPPEGISDLIEITNELMPEGLQAGEKDLATFVLKRKKVLAQSCIYAFTTGAVAVGAIPIPFSDAAILAPLETTEINILAKIYGINKGEESKQLFKSLIEVGTVSAAAKALISGLKAIPGINIAASVLNAVVAGAIVIAMGEGESIIFEKVYLGEKTLDDIDWMKKLLESKLSTGIVQKGKDALATLNDTSSAKDIVSAILNAFRQRDDE